MGEVNWKMLQGRRGFNKPCYRVRGQYCNNQCGYCPFATLARRHRELTADIKEVE